MRERAPRGRALVDQYRLGARAVLGRRGARALAAALSAAAVTAMLAIAPPAGAAPSAPRSSVRGSAAQRTATAQGQLVTDPTAYVDPMIGTGNGGDVVGDINDFPGVDVPFGMMQLSPDTQNNGEGYSYDSSTITDFSVDHASTGCGSFGDVPMLPVTGAVTDPNSATASFSHDNEQATLGSYNVLLQNSGINVGLTASTHTGLVSVKYPGGSPARFLVKSGSSHAGISAASVRVTGSDEVSGSQTTEGLCNEGQYKIYFDITFDHPFTGMGTWAGDTVTDGSRSASGSGSGAYVSFPAGSSVIAKVAVSYVNVAGARANMAAEIPGWNVAKVQKHARDAWRKALSKVQVGGGTQGDLTTFYTALYHSMQFPTVFNDVTGKYTGFDGKTHTVPAGHSQYATFSDWDIYRALAPLQATLFPQRAGDMANSLLHDAQQLGGWMPRWPIADTSGIGTMNGDNSVPLFANLAAFGGKGVQAGAILPIMENGANHSQELTWGWEERPCVEEYVQLGYAPNDACSQGAHGRQGVSETLEWSIDDFAISQLAARVGDTQVASAYQLRAQSWQNVLNPATGYQQPRDENGAFPNGPAFVTPPANAFGQDGYDEGNAADYNWLVPQNIAGLVASMGGRSVAIPRLDQFFTQDNAGPNLPYMWAGNEIDLAVPFVYDYLGQPWKTQAQVREQEQQLYPPTPDGLPGNDDLGAMSSWFVWAALGIYPVTPGTPDLALGSPLFKHAVVHLANGRQIRIDAPAAADDAPYVNAVQLNGAEQDSTALPQNLVRRGGTLTFDLARQANHSWATADSAAPPSYQTGQAPAIGFITPNGQPGQVVVTAGDSVAETVGAEGTGLRATTVRWQASAPAGVTVTPASGTLRVPRSGEVSVPATITASSSIASGYYPVRFSYTTADGAPLGPGNVVVLTVQQDDQTAIVADDLGNPDVPNGLTEVDQGDGQTIATTAGGLAGRTTTGSGSSYMYFQLDDSLVPGGDYQATAYVSYYDHGTGSWDIQYDSADPDDAYHNSASVTDTNTDTWKTAAIPLDGAGFNDRENGGSDLRLSIGSGQQVIGRVALSVTGGNVLAMHLASAQPVAPTVQSQPADATVAVGANATFSVAGAGDPEPVVQWQSMAPGGSWDDVSGATGSTLTVSDVTAGDDGTQYRAVLTNLAGSVTSAAATLHVR